MEVYRNHHFAAHALTRLLTDNRDWAFGFEDHFKRIAVPTTILVADHKAGGAIMREEMSLSPTHRVAAGEIGILGKRRPRHEGRQASGIQQSVGSLAELTNHETG